MSSSQKPWPKPNVDVSADGRGMNQGIVRAFFSNPVYAGVSPYPQLVDDDTWVLAAAIA